MRLNAEFTTEPFHGEGEPPRHATGPAEVLRSRGPACELGPFGTTTSGTLDELADAIALVLRAAFDHGADRITLQVERADG
jgi:uncharacterized protein YqgV (UPF0045/DUF77 family)